MNLKRKSSQIYLALTVSLSLPPAAAGETCPIALDTPALLTVEATSEINLNATNHAAILEKSPTHLVIAASRPGTLRIETSAGCDIHTSLERTAIRERMVSSGSAKAPAIVAAFYPLELATKEEDHDIDPDPDHPIQGAPATPLLTLIHLKGTISTKEEDHDIDPDPDFQSPVGDRQLVLGGIPTKEEDHDIDPDPDQPLAGDAWARDWSSTADLVRQLGPGWYFVIKGGEVMQEILIDSRR